jgi:hypothetical protein
MDNTSPRTFVFIIALTFFATMPIHPLSWLVVVQLQVEQLET